MLSIFATAILPVVAVAAASFAPGRLKGADPDALNTITVYVLAPALVVHGLATSSPAGDTILSVVLAVVLFTGVVHLAAGDADRRDDHHPRWRVQPRDGGPVAGRTRQRNGASDDHRKYSNGHVAGGLLQSGLVL
jgi:predicted permease